MEKHRARNNHLVNEILLTAIEPPIGSSSSTQQPLSVPTTPTQAPAFAGHMHQVNSYFDMLDERDVVRKHPRNWPRPTGIGGADHTRSVPTVSEISIFGSSNNLSSLDRDILTSPLPPITDESHGCRSLSHKLLQDLWTAG